MHSDMEPFQVRDQTVAVRVSRGERDHVHRRACDAGFRTTSDFARYLTIDAPGRRQSVADLARQRCVHLLVLLVSATTEAAATLPDPHGATAVGLATLRDLYCALLSDGGPPEPPRGPGDRVSNAAPSSARRDVFIQIRCSRAELAELERRAGVAGVSACLRTRLLRPTRASTRRADAAERWLRLLAACLERTRLGQLRGPAGLDEAVEWSLEALEREFTRGAGEGA